MKKLFLTIILLLIAMNNVVGQNLNNHWQLGVSDVNFSSNPATVSTVANNGKYGKASISDSNGNLLFYSDGINVWNKNHQIMQDGSNIGSPENYSDIQTQPCLIVPYPNNPQKFYIFTTANGVLTNQSTYPGYSYKLYLVDFSDSNYPLGKVVYLNNLSLEGLINTPYTYTYRPITVINNSTNDGYFVVVQRAYSNINSDFLAYKITSSGIDLTPITSNITNNTSFFESSGFAGTTEVKPYGTFKFSPDKSKLGVLVRLQKYHTGTHQYSSSSKFFTLNFNNSSGVFSNFNLVQDSDNTTTNINTIYDFEFSTDSQKVFLLSNKIYVKDLLNTTLSARSLSDINNTSIIPNGFNKIQRDKYNNILLSSNSTLNNQNTFIHKIENQDSFSNSSVRINYLSLNNNTINYLPQLIPELTPICPNNLTVSTNVTTSIDKKQAANDITATNTISSGAGAIYHAGNSVTLKPTFTALAGSTFHGYVAGCTGTFIAKQSTSTNSTKSDEESIDTSIKSVEKIIQIAPNPNNGIFNIILKNDLKEGTIQITDLVGFTVYKANFKDQKEIEVNIQDNPKGIYIVKVFSGDQTYTEKIIKN